MFTLSYGENTHILLEDRKSLDRPATLEKIRAEQQAAVEAANSQPPPVDDDDVIILDATGQEPGAVLPKIKHIPLPLHFRTTFISLKPPTIFEQFLGQVKAKWTSRPTSAILDGLTCMIGTDWVVRLGYIGQGSTQKGIMLEVEYLPLQTYPSTVEGKPPAILAEFVSSIVPQSHSDYAFVPSRFSEEQWLEILGSGNDIQTDKAKQAVRTNSIYTTGFEQAIAPPVDWGNGFAQERRSAFLLLRMLLDERLLN
ncbi:mediator complex subunit Med20 [Ceratobasidium sp. AG-Ba]|nr:mediator complex subunit Med20 [Ceratobasidium sp. AG-Ba]